LSVQRLSRIISAAFGARAIAWKADVQITVQLDGLDFVDSARGLVSNYQNMRGTITGSLMVCVRTCNATGQSQQLNPFSSSRACCSAFGMQIGRRLSAPASAPSSKRDSASPSSELLCFARAGLDDCLQCLHKRRADGLELGLVRD
jgi:hypothetical protein